MSYNLKNDYAAAVGREGEDKVAAYLRQKGYIILKRNYRDRFGEIDIIASDGENLRFVEVKTRTGNAMVSGIEAVDRHKQHRIFATASEFLRKINHEYTPFFDVAEVTLYLDENGEVRWELQYIRDAFKWRR